MGLGNIQTSWMCTSPRCLWDDPGPCGVLGPVLGYRVHQGVSKITTGLERLVGKERQRELEEVSLEKGRLGILQFSSETPDGAL